MAPNAEVEDIITMTSSQSKVHILKAAIFHTMAYKLSLEINKNKITPKTIIAFLKVLYNVAQIKTKKSLLNSTLDFIWLAKNHNLRNCIKCCFRFEFCIYIKRPIFPHCHTRSNPCLQQHSQRLWVHPNP